jgi:hypothetical protein
VQVDETRGDEKSRRVDLARPRTGHRTDSRDHALRDGDIADIGLAAEAVDDGAVADDQVVRH